MNEAYQENDISLDSGRSEGGRSSRRRRSRSKSKSNADKANQMLKSAVNITKNKIIEFLSSQGASDDDLQRWRQSDIKDWQLRRHQVKKVIAKKSERMNSIREVESVGESSSINDSRISSRRSSSSLNQSINDDPPEHDDIDADQDDQVEPVNQKNRNGQGIEL